MFMLPKQDPDQTSKNKKKIFLAKTKNGPFPKKKIFGKNQKRSVASQKICFWSGSVKKTTSALVFGLFFWSASYLTFYAQSVFIHSYPLSLFCNHLSLFCICLSVCVLYKVTKDDLGQQTLFCCVCVACMST